MDDGIKTDHDEIEQFNRRLSAHARLANTDLDNPNDSLQRLLALLDYKTHGPLYTLIGCCIERNRGQILEVKKMLARVAGVELVTLDTTIDASYLPPAVRGFLLKAGYATIRDLKAAVAKPGQLLSVAGIGPKAIRVIREAVADAESNTEPEKRQIA